MRRGTELGHQAITGLSQVGCVIMTVPCELCLNSRSWNSNIQRPHDQASGRSVLTTAE